MKLLNVLVRNTAIPNGNEYIIPPMGQWKPENVKDMCQLKENARLFVLNGNQISYLGSVVHNPRFWYKGGGPSPISRVPQLFEILFWDRGPTATFLGRGDNYLAFFRKDVLLTDVF